MSLLVKMTLSAALVLSIGVPFGAFAAGEKTKGRYKTALGVNVFLFFGTMIAAAAFMFSGNAFADLMEHRDKEFLFHKCYDSVIYAG